jgi:hypothetical protein
MLDGVTIGKPVNRTLELRTTDGRFALRGADIEMKAPPRGASGGASFTFVKLNVGDAQLLSPQGAIAITKDVQAFTAGKAATDKAVSLTDVAMTPTRVSTTLTAPTVEPIANLPAAPLPVQPTPLLRTDPLVPMLTPLPVAPSAPVVPSTDTFLKPVTNLVIAPVTTTLAPAAPPVKQQLILAPVTSPTLLCLPGARC